MKSNTYDKYKFFVIISTIITIFVVGIVDKPIEYSRIIFIPIVYLLFFINNKLLHKYSRINNGLLLLNILMYIKYVFAIIIISIFKDYNAPSFYASTASTNNYFLAIIYMIIELISIHFVIIIFGRHFYRKYRDRH